MPPENRIQLTIEAYNMAKATLDALGKQIKAIGDESGRAGSAGKSMLSGLKENWLAVTAAAAAAGVAIAKALEYMEKGAKAEQAEESFRRVAAAAGESADEIVEAMKRAANGTVDDSDIMQKAVKGMVQGLSGEQLVKIMEAARTAARTTGEDVGTAYESITDSIANKLPRGLIKYGLITKEQMRMLNEAAAMGITEIDLYALAMENAGGQLEKFGELQDTNAEKMQMWKAQLKEIEESIGRGLFEYLLNPLFAAFEKIGTSIASLFSRIATLWDWVKSGMKGGLSKLREMEGEEEEAWKARIAQINEKYYGAGKPSSSPGAPSAAPRPKGGNGASEQLKEVLAMKAREAAIQRELTQLDVAEKNRELSHLDAAKERLRLEEELLAVQNKNLAPINDPNARASKQKELDATIAKVSELKLALRELNGSFSSGVDEGFKRYLDTVRSRFQEGVYIAQQAAQAMEQAFSDFFFDAMTGKLKSMWDYIKSFLLSVARAIANIMAQQTAQGIIGSFMGPAAAGGGAGATAGVSAGASAGAGAGVGGFVPPFHAGGYVPRFHVGGLSSDERPAILQTGEYVVSRKGMAALDRINSGDAGEGGVTVNVINQSSQPVKATPGPTQFDGRRMVASVILSDFEGYGPIRHAVEGLGARRG